MNYEQFLFTRNQRRDFTAFVRPTDMTNKEVSLLASAFNFITDVAALTADAPGLYCFSLGAYTFVLRHYDSGRKHAGREIGVIEGIAVRREDSAALAAHLAELVERQADVLDVIGSVGDVEELEVRKSEVHALPPSARSSLRSDYGQQKVADPLSPSGREEKEALDGTVSEQVSLATLQDFPAEELDPNVEETDSLPDDDYLVDAGARLADEQLVLPFSREGQALLIEVLRLELSKPLRFAFGTNGDVTGHLTEAGIEFDIVGLFSADEPAFRPRARKSATVPVRVEPQPPATRQPEPMEESTPPVPRRRPLLVRLLRWLVGR